MLFTTEFANTLAICEFKFALHSLGIGWQWLCMPKPTASWLLPLRSKTTEITHKLLPALMFSQCYQLWNGPHHASKRVFQPTRHHLDQALFDDDQRLLQSSVPIPKGLAITVLKKKRHNLGSGQDFKLGGQQSPKIMIMNNTKAIESNILATRQEQRNSLSVRLSIGNPQM